LANFDRVMLRRFLALSIATCLLGGVWLRSPAEPQNRDARLALTPLPIPTGCCTAGPLNLIGAWQLESRHHDFGGYSALLIPHAGRLLAFSDRGYSLAFSAPGAPQEPIRIGPLLEDSARLKDNRDVESATRDPASGRIWIGLEGRQAIARHGPDLRRERFRQVPEMAGWPQNQGPEAMLRLRDGRFVVLCECQPGRFQSGRHPALLFGGDPTGDAVALTFTFAGAEGYRPTAMAQLPDGRVLIVVRRLVWPVPARFAIKILIADPAQIAPGMVWQGREVADLADPWPIDNFEGLAIERQAGGSLIGWLISDENGAVTQRVLLLKLRIDESKL
jgi:Esterase-like activity of phytase